VKKGRRNNIARLAFIFVFATLLVVVGALISVGLGKMVIKANEIPTVYMTHGDQDTCTKAKDAQGKSISCEEAMMGVYHTVWIAPKTLNEN